MADKMNFRPFLKFKDFKHRIERLGIPQNHWILGEYLPKIPLLLPEILL